MRLQFVQNLIDTLRGKAAVARGLPVTVDNVASNHIDPLFDRFASAEFTFNGATRRWLTNVNADRGVTEQTLSLLCEAFPTGREQVKVLNIGCGKKDQMAFLQALGFDAYGVDYDIDEDTDRIKFHDLNTGDDLPFPADTFDCVVCQEIIEHIENPWLLFRKIKRLLKVGGTLVVTTPNISSLQSRKKFANNAIGFFAYFDAANLWQHINPIPYWEMVHIATFNGFASVSLSGNNEYYVRYVPKKPDPRGTGRRDATLQNNDVLHYVFRNLDRDIKVYSPVPTYNNDRTAAAQGRDGATPS